MAFEALKSDEFNRARMVTKEELDHKIQAVTEGVLNAAEPVAPDEPMCPRIISAAELVRRMKPFMVYN